MAVKLVSSSVERLPHSATEEVDNSVKRMQRGGVKDIISLGVGEPCFDTPENIKEASIKALRDGNTKYQPTAGSYELREAICQKLKRENGIEAGVDDIVVTAGGKFAIYLAFQAFLERGDQVLIFDPAWVSYEPVAMLAGAEVIRISTDSKKGFKPDLDAITKVMNSAVKLVVINSPCNPTGAVFSKETLRQITEISNSYDALVLSDEVYEYQVYDTEHYSPGSEFDNVITVNAFSKSHAMTGWRLGYATGPKEVLEAMLTIYQHSTSCVTSFAQNGAIEALQSEASKRAADEMLREYRRRRDLMVELINASQFLDLEVLPEGAFYCFPSYHLEMPSLDLAKMLLEDVHVATVPGAAFGACGEGHLRLSYATTLEDIRQAFERMDDFFQSQKVTRIGIG